VQNGGARMFWLCQWGSGVRPGGGEGQREGGAESATAHRLAGERSGEERDVPALPRCQPHPLSRRSSRGGGRAVETSHRKQSARAVCNLALRDSSTRANSNNGTMRTPTTLTTRLQLSQAAASRFHQPWRLHPVQTSTRPENASHMPTRRRSTRLGVSRAKSPSACLQCLKSACRPV
jgi:hypothetical protein